MRIIKEAFLLAAGREHPPGGAALGRLAQDGQGGNVAQSGGRAAKLPGHGRRESPQWADGVDIQHPPE